MEVVAAALQCKAIREHKHVGQPYASAPYHTHIHRCRYEYKHPGKHKCQFCAHQWNKEKRSHVRQR